MLRAGGSLGWVVRGPRELWYGYRVRRYVLGLLLLSACGDHGVSGTDSDGGPGDGDARNNMLDAKPDAFPCGVDMTPVSDCWPTVTYVPHGSLTIGMGRGGFSPMPDNAPIEWGFQDGFMFVLAYRMTGFDPGVPQCALDPKNPRTRTRVFFNDSNIPLSTGQSCPVRMPYKEYAPGEYETVVEVPFVFDLCWRSDTLIGSSLRIEAEILDPATGHYASETRVVTVAPPVNPAYPTDPGGCPQ
jgi:hypothetical protein